jgi:hypothetical protein
MTSTAQNILYSEKDPEFQIWLQILKHSPTDLWEQPILTFIDSVKEKLPDDKIGLSNENVEQCNNFMRNIARYIYAKSLANEPNDDLTIKQEMLKATELAKEGNIYEPNYKVTKNFNLSKQFKQKLNGNIPQKLRWGLCAIVEFTNSHDIYMQRDHQKILQSKLKEKTSVLETAVVEQIFPDNWEPDLSDPWHEVVYNNEIDCWNDRKIRKALKTIGNLVLIEQDIYENTKKLCKGNFFGERKNPNIHKNYRDSIFGEVLFISIDRHANYEVPWSYSFYMHRQQYCIKRLTIFFSGSGECILH